MKNTILILILILLISTMIYICYVKFNTSLYNVSSDLEGFQNGTGSHPHIAKIHQEMMRLRKKLGKKGMMKLRMAMRKARQKSAYEDWVRRGKPVTR